MTLLKIARLGHPVLRQTAAPILDPADPAVMQLIESMLVTMHDASGVGLAAPQVHESSRIIVILPERRADAKPLALINPVITPLSDKRAEDWEGCLSIPGLRGIVPRYTHLHYAADLPGGGRVEGEAHDFHARVLQHEVDHLDGLTYLERMDDLSTLTFIEEMQHARAPKNQP